MKSFIKLFILAISLLFYVQVVGAEEMKLEQNKLSPEQVKNVKSDLNYLFQKSITKIKDMLEEDGDFYPFGAATFPSGKVKFVWVGDKSDTNKPKPELAIAVVRRALQANAVQNSLYSTGVYYVTGVENEKTGKLERQLVAELEHHNGVAVVKVIQFKLVDGVLELGKGVEQDQQPRIYKTAE